MSLRRRIAEKMSCKSVRSHNGFYSIWYLLDPEGRTVLGMNDWPKAICEVALELAEETGL